MAYLAIRHLSKRYRVEGRPLPVLDALDIEVAKGELLVLLGPSGCGKSTLLRLVAGLEAPDAGRITLAGQAVEGPSRERTLVFQEGLLFPWLTAVENVAFGLRALGLDESSRRARASEQLGRLGLDGYQTLYPHQLSLGMRQRVAIARALVLDPELLLLDEPFASVDSLMRAQLQDELLAIWRRRRLTTLFVTHSVSEAVLLADRIALFSERPARLLAVHAVDIPQPRREHPELLAEWRTRIANEIAGDANTTLRSADNA